MDDGGEPRVFAAAGEIPQAGGVRFVEIVGGPAHLAAHRQTSLFRLVALELAIANEGLPRHLDVDAHHPHAFQQAGAAENAVDGVQPDDRLGVALAVDRRANRHRLLDIDHVRGRRLGQDARNPADAGRADVQMVFAAEGLGGEERDAAGMAPAESGGGGGVKGKNVEGGAHRSAP